MREVYTQTVKTFSLVYNDFGATPNYQRLPAQEMLPVSKKLAILATAIAVATEEANANATASAGAANTASCCGKIAVVRTAAENHLRTT